jgi:beta-lactamase class A
MLTLILAATLTLPPQKSDAVIGVAAIDLQTGQRISVRGKERFRMWSVYKVPIALEVLRRVDAGTLKPEQAITIGPEDFSLGWSPLRDRANGQPITMPLAEWMEWMVKESDNTACDALLRLVGPRAVNRRIAKLGVRGVRVDRQEREQIADVRSPGGPERYTTDVRDTATPEGMLALFTAIAQRRDGLSRESHDRLLRWMTETKTGANRIKAGVPAGVVIAHKTGSGPGTTNDVAILDGRIVLVILTRNATVSNEEVEPDIAAVARAVYEELTRSR